MNYLSAKLEFIQWPIIAQGKSHIRELEISDIPLHLSSQVHQTFSTLSPLLSSAYVGRTRRQQRHLLLAVGKYGNI